MSTDRQDISSGSPALQPTPPYAYFLGGTLVLEGVERTVRPPAPFQWLNARWRCPAVHYRTIRPWLREQGIRNAVPRWRDLTLTLHDDREPHPYQAEALQAWLEGNRWGSIVLPTGAGKTLLALRAIAATPVSTLVVVPTLDLLHQWYAVLENAFGITIGVWYGQEKKLEPITVTTYPSAYARAEALGDQFKFIIFDEIHHLPAPSWHEIALMCAAPYRLGLTATYPERRKDEGGRMKGEDEVSSFSLQPSALLEELVGPVLYEKQIDDLAGEQLAEYRTLRLRVDLTPAERSAYDVALGAYTGYVREARLRESHGHGWWFELTRRSAHDHQARRAKVAELKLKEIVHQAQGKLMALDQLLREHRDQQMLIFTAHNRFAYQIARRHLIPAITHQTTAAERKAILDGFRAGTYRAIVTSKVLNEGVDVPEAKIAVVLGGSASAREYVQRLGRVLRKQGNTQAILYEVIARKTVDEGIAQRRKPK
ncbi:MAG: DEAD/DEAH box helicase [Anaerolineae bacterium]|nr:DEAD/DEAH box helicase [Anaerolineae bacterium]